MCVSESVRQAAQNSRDDQACLWPSPCSQYLVLYTKDGLAHLLPRGPGMGLSVLLGGQVQQDDWLTLPSATSSLASVRVLLSVLLANSVLYGVDPGPHLPTDSKLSVCLCALVLGPGGVVIRKPFLPLPGP